MYTGLPTYKRLVYPDLWPGIDLVYSGDMDHLTYEFIVKPGADPSQIRLAYWGAEGLALNAAGQLVVSTPAGDLQDDVPIAYQEIDGRRVAVEVGYDLLLTPILSQRERESNTPLPSGKGMGVREYSFHLSSYDPSQTLVIDPAILVYAGYIGGNGDDRGYSIAVDGNGAAYITGMTDSDESTFPVMVGPDLTYNGSGDHDAFVAKVRPDGMGLVYAGYIGGSDEDLGYGIAVDGSGAAYVTGSTCSDESTFPVTVGPDLTYNGGTYGDAFVAKVRPDGTGLVYAGYIGGSQKDMGLGIAVDASGAAYITGYTTSDETTFPITVGPDLTYNSAWDAFVAKVRPDGIGLVYAGYIGGSNDDAGFGIAVDGSGAAYVTGYTLSDESTFPVAVGPDLTYNGFQAAFIAKVLPDGARFAYAGYIGGNDGTEGFGIAVDGSGAAYVTGYTNSDETTFPVTVGPDLTYNGGSDTFVAKVRPDGSSFAYAGYIGGDSSDLGCGIAVDGSGVAYVTGDTQSDESTFPITVGPGLTYQGNGDTFVVKVRPDGTALVYASYIGGSCTDNGSGIAVDGSGAAYVTGETCTDESTFPISVGPDLTYNGSWDAFVVKVNWGGSSGYSISGHVTDPSGGGLAGVTITATGGITMTVATTTDSTGAYILYGLVPLSTYYTLTPSKFGYTFSPTVRPVVISTSDVGNIDFYGQATDQRVDPGQSSLEADLVNLPANGSTVSHVTATLRNKDGIPLAGKQVDLLSDRGPQDEIAQPGAPTDSNGQSSGQIRSTTAGNTTLQAWVLSDRTAVTSLVTIEFTQAVPLNGQVRNEANKVAAAAQNTLDQIWEDGQAIVEEYKFFKQDLTQKEYEMAADIVSGAIDVMSGAADWKKNGSQALQISLPGWEQNLESAHFSDKVWCKVGNQLINSFSQLAGDDLGEKMSRWSLRLGILLSKAQMSDQCLKDITKESVKDAFNIGAIIGSYVPASSINWPMKKQIDQSSDFVQSQINQINSLLTRPLTSGEIQAYVNDLVGRHRALFLYENRVRYARFTLEAFHTANTNGPAGGEWTEAMFRLGAKGLAASFDGAGQVLVGGYLTILDTYMNASAVSEEMSIVTLGEQSIVKTIPEAVSAATNNVTTGLDLILRGVIPQVPSGYISDIHHYSKGSWWGPFWNEDCSYTTVTIHNTSSVVADFYVISQYQAQTTRLGVPWGTLWLTSESTPVRVPAYSARIVTIFYHNYNDSYSPREAYTVLFNSIPASPISLDLIATNPYGVYQLQHYGGAQSQWVPERMSNYSGLAGLMSQTTIPTSDEAPTIDSPIIVAVGTSPDWTHLTGRVWFNNPYDQIVTASIHQPIPAGTTVQDPGSGRIEDGVLTITGPIAPYATTMFTFTFGMDGAPGSQQTLTAATLEVTPTTGIPLTTTAAAPVFVLPIPFTTQRTLPVWVEPGNTAQGEVRFQNQISTTVAGTFTFHIFDADGVEPVLPITQPVSLGAGVELTLPITIPASLAIGDYNISGTFKINGALIPLFDEPFCVYAYPPQVVTTAQSRPDGVIQPGESINFQTLVTNTASAPLSGIVVTLPISDGLMVVGSSIDQGGVYSDSMITWHIPSLGPGASLSLSFMVQVPANYVLPGESQTIKMGASLQSNETPPMTGIAETLFVVCLKKIYLPIINRN